jgi:hypothetical protein
LDAFGSVNKKSQNGNHVDIFGANRHSVVSSLSFLVEGVMTGYVNNQKD